MRFIRGHRAVLTAAATTVVAGAIITSAVAASASSNPSSHPHAQQQQQRRAAVVHPEATPSPSGTVIASPRNASGLTYGSDLDAASFADTPDLISAIADNGKLGYVMKTDIYSPAPNNPDDAISQNAQAQQTRTIPVYAHDGETVIGKFTISANVPNS